VTEKENFNSNASKRPEGMHYRTAVHVTCAVEQFSENPPTEPRIEKRTIVRSHRSHPIRET
jgi:hypothetical protein